MPAAIKAGRLLKRCEVCGEAASYGHDVRLRDAMTAAAAGQVDKAKALLGRWYCEQHEGAEHGGNSGFSDAGEKA